MIRVEPALPADFEEVAPLLDGFHNAAISREQWRSLFQYSWPASETARGFILRDHARAVGFFGTVWSEREVAGRRERICNLTSWITLPEHRHQSLLLFKTVLALTDCTITCHSPAPHLYKLYRRFGFSDLETKLRILLPWPSGRCGWRYRIATDPAEIAPLLAEEDRRILEAHRPHHCGHLLIHGGGESCYVLFTRTKGRRRHFAHIHYLSRPALFACALDRVKWRLFRATGTPLIMLDARLAAGLDLPHSREAALGTPHVFRSATLAPAQIDNLYSELILLGL